MKIEKENIKQFKKRRSDLTFDGQPQIVVMKDNSNNDNKGVCTSPYR